MTEHDGVRLLWFPRGESVDEAGKWLSKLSLTDRFCGIVAGFFRALIRPALAHRAPKRRK